MSFTKSVVLALFDWHCSSARLTAMAQSAPPVGSFILHGQAAIDRLPNELLSAVFTFAIEPAHADDLTTSTTIPMIISQVCRRWRLAALATGSLWTHIVLTFPTSPGQITRTLTWLARSRNAGLDLWLDLRDPDWDFSDEETHGFCSTDMKDVLELLLPYAHRWRKVDLFTDTWEPIFAFLQQTGSHAVGASLGRLEHLHLARCNAYFAAKGQEFEPAALSAPLPLFGCNGTAGEVTVLPRLRSVSLIGVHIDWATPPLVGLTKLEFKYQAADVMPSVAQFALIVAASPALRELTIVGCGPKFPRSPTAPHGASAQALSQPNENHQGAAVRIKFAKVTHFTFGFVDVAYAVQLLSILEFPTLRSLSLENVAASLREETPDDAGALLDWLCGRTQTSNDIVSFPSLTPSTSAPSIPPLSSPASSSGSRIPLAQLSKLALYSIHAPLPAFTRLFSASVNIHTLHLSDIDASALGILAGTRCDYARKAALPLPNLEKLTARNVEESTFARVIQLRRDAGLECTATLEREAADQPDGDDDGDSDDDDGD